jgi:hypothetical protein
MATTAASIWDWTLPVLPCTAMITLLVTLVACNLVSNYASFGDTLLQISQLGMGRTYVYFIVGVAMLFPQVLAIIIGRLQFLLQIQSIINRIVLYIIHIISLIPLVFMLIVTLISRDSRSDVYLLGTYGIFECIPLYCFIYTLVMFYQYIYVDRMLCYMRKSFGQYGFLFVVYSLSSFLLSGLKLAESFEDTLLSFLLFYIF